MIIKRDVAAAFTLLTQQTLTEPAPAQDKTDPELAALRHDVEELRRLLGEASIERDLAVEQARADAIEEAARAHERADAAALAALRSGIDAAIAGFRERLDELDDLAFEAARLVLAKVFGPDMENESQTRRALQRQLSLLREEGVVAVFVSPAEFGAESALETLREGVEGARVEYDHRLCPGEVRVTLALGELELSLPAYWQAVSTALSPQMSAP